MWLITKKKHEAIVNKVCREYEAELAEAFTTLSEERKKCINCTYKQDRLGKLCTLLERHIAMHPNKDGAECGTK